jgi:hypothetical protein
MARKYILIKRQNKILYAEFLVASVVGAWLTTACMNWHPAIGILFGIVSYFLIGYLFFAYRFFRYSFSILFSLGWAAAAFVAGQNIERISDTTAWVFAVIAFGLSLWAHWNHFDFLRNAEAREFEM